MKKTLFLLYFISSLAVAFGQESQDICTYLQETGRVSIIQDSRLAELVGNQPQAYYANGSRSGNTNNTIGYRIRVFSGNQQTTSKNRCYSIQAYINQEMPDLPTYVAFKTPNWRVSVGDFRTSEEASSMLAQLRKAFPGYAKDMFIVKEKINL
ncbi:MAG: SPOR domain-containing protein [Bacteroidales bacterium]|jgi:hypothetical protein|nr:SPOR domain-containing protein [Bacteroidales bacterium]